MPYSKEHKNTTRARILSSAISLFSRRGLDKVSIDELMSHAGLTRGAFYAHFKNKQMLYSEAILAGAKQGQISNRKPEDIELRDWMVTILTRYMSEAHVNQETTPCPLAFLITDIANSEEEVRNTYTKVFKLLNDAIHNGIRKAGNAEVNESQINAAMAMMIGSVAIGRALNDDALTKQLLESSRVNVLNLLNL